MSSTFDIPAPTLGFLLNDVARLLRKRFEQNGKELGLTRAQWQVLAVLQRAEGIQQSALADILEIEPITLARILDRLEAASLVERRPHPTDRRIKQLYLRPEAVPLIAQMRAIGDLTRGEALVGVSETEQARLAEILTTMRENLSRACGAACRQKAMSHG